MSSSLLPSLMSAASGQFVWPWESPPPPPPPPPSAMEGLPLLTAIIAAWVLPTLGILSYAHSKKPQSPKAKSAVDGTGKSVPKDTERRKVAEKQDAEGGVNKHKNLQRFLLFLFVAIPHSLAWKYQENPTVAEQVSGWASTSWAHLFDNQLTFHFQLAVGLLFIERLCYTWVHSFSGSFVEFAQSAVGKRMGKKPLDVVLTIFYINKVIQLGTFLGFYFYILDFESPFNRGFAWAKVTPLQWIWLVHAIVLGQGLNASIYRAIGKPGVYYGYRLGVDVPWVTGFPFSVVPHPQYFGVCVAVIGINIFVATPAHIAAGWFNLTLVQVLFYCYMAIVEDYL